MVQYPLSSGSNSVVECDLAKVEVAGSNPVSRSRFFGFSNLLVLRRWIFLRYGMPTI
jgi:hypothetical protein